MPQPFFNITVLKSYSLDQRLRLISTLTRLLQSESYVCTYNSYESAVRLILALSTPEADVRTYSWDDDNTRDTDNFYDSPKSVILDDSLQGNRFLIKLRQLKKCKTLKEALESMEMNDKADATRVFDTELDFQRFQSIILSDEERKLNL